MKINLWKLLPAGLALAADQIAKYFARTRLSSSGRLVLFPNFLALRYAENTGAAFSFLAACPGLIALITAGLILAVGIWLFRDKNMGRLCSLSLSLVIGGGIGNLIDRVCLGFVVDFIEVLFVRFAIFNIADCAICAGAFLCALSLTGRKKK